MADDYTHPESGRVYRDGDPAHRFAKLVAALAEQCDEFLYHHGTRLSGHDYLQQHTEWTSDPDRIARTMGYMVEEIDQAYTDVVVDRELHRYGLSNKDDEWHRKYGPAEGAS